MTHLEIIDTAVKVGLGALISAVATVSVTLVRGGQERKAERRARRCEVIERVGSDFERQHTVFIELYSAYGTYLEATNQTVRGLAWQNVHECMVHRVRPALLALHECESRLHVIDAGSAAALIQSYLFAVTTQQEKVKMIDGTEGAPPTKSMWESLGRDVSNARVEVYNRLSKEYKQA